MFSHIVVGTNDIDAAKRFYDAIFVAAGGTAGTIDPKGRIMYAKDGKRFMVTRPLDGNPATHANGGTIGLLMESAEMVDAWHAAGLANGGVNAESLPGVRVHGDRRIYIGYLRDPDGNKLCASAAA